MNSIQEGYVSLGVVTVRSHRPENGWFPAFFDKAGARATAVRVRTRQSDLISYIVYLNCDDSFDGAAAERRVQNRLRLMR
jgi:hypothetical protein